MTELGSVTKPRGGSRLTDKCRVCGEAELWSSYFTPDGNGCSGNEPGARYLTMCQSCGTFYETGGRK